MTNKADEWVCKTEKTNRLTADDWGERFPIYDATTILACRVNYSVRRRSIATICEPRYRDVAKAFALREFQSSGGDQDQK
jgi:hypothetical protein